MICPNCNSDDITPERSSGYKGYRCKSCGEWHYETHMNNNKINTMKELEHKVRDMIKEYGIDEEDVRIINDFLIDGMHLYGIVEMGRELPESEFK